MFCSFNEFNAWYEKANEIFKKFEDNASYFMTRTRSNNVSNIISSASAHTRASYHYIPLKNRLDQIFKIR